MMKEILLEWLEHLSKYAKETEPVCGMQYDKERCYRCVNEYECAQLAQQNKVFKKLTSELTKYVVS